MRYTASLYAAARALNRSVMRVLRPGEAKNQEVRRVMMMQQESSRGQLTHQWEETVVMHQTIPRRVSNPGQATHRSLLKSSFSDALNPPPPPRALVVLLAPPPPIAEAPNTPMDDAPKPCPIIVVT